MKNRKSVKDYICSPLGGVVIIIIIVLIIVLLVELAVSRRFSTDDSITGDIEGGYSYQYDPASQTQIGIMPSTNGDSEEEPMYVGLEVLIQSGMTAEQYSVFKDVMKKYASDNDISLKRVSYLKDSYSLGGLYVFDFTVVLNVNEKALRVRVDSSEGWKNIVGMKVYLWDKNGNEVYLFEVNEENKCNYLEEC